MFDSDIFTIMAHSPESQHYRASAGNLSFHFTSVPDAESRLLQCLGTLKNLGVIGPLISVDPHVLLMKTNKPVRNPPDLAVLREHGLLDAIFH